LERARIALKWTASGIGIAKRDRDAPYWYGWRHKFRKKLKKRAENPLRETQGLMSAATDVYNVPMKIVKYFTLLALAAAALSVSACCGNPPPPPPPPAPAAGLSK
jgi:hypothetical protein